MPSIRVTVTVDLVEHDGRKTWSHTETQEGNSVGNPRFIADDVETALRLASTETKGVTEARFGTLPAGAILHRADSRS